MTSVIFFGLKFFVKFVFEIKIIFFWNFFENPLKFNQKPLETHSHGFLSCARLTAQYHLRQRQKSRFDTLLQGPIFSRGQKKLEFSIVKSVSGTDFKNRGFFGILRKSVKSAGLARYF